MLRLNNALTNTLSTNLTTPAMLKREIPISPAAINFIKNSRSQADAIIKQKDNRLLVIVGPCSIHDPTAALEYARFLQEQTIKHQDTLLIFMRTYFEKPRTTLGWKGLMYDPQLNNSYRINEGLALARQLLHDLTQQNIPCATEFLSTIFPAYISDLVSWCAIGARTTESQIHRELISNLAIPTGFKNGTDGNVQIAVDAILSASQPHHYIGLSKHGAPMLVKSAGNTMSHIILRGAHQTTNYDAKSIDEACKRLEKNQLAPSIMVDCSHGNSLKDYRRQSIVIDDVASQILNGSKHIMGVMFESNLVEGRQDIRTKDDLVYGQSITDACVGISETIALFDVLSAAVKLRRKKW